MGKTKLVNKKGAETGEWFNPDTSQLFEEQLPQGIELFEASSFKTALYRTTRGNWILMTDDQNMADPFITYVKISRPLAYRWLFENGYEIPMELRDHAPKPREV